MTLVVGLLHGATVLPNLPLVLFVSFIGPQQLERTPVKPLSIKKKSFQTILFNSSTSQLKSMHGLLKILADF